MIYNCSLRKKKNTFIIIINVVAIETVRLLYFFAFTSATSVHFNLLSTPQSQFSTSSYSSVSYYYCPMCCAGCILIMFRRNWAIKPEGKRERPRNLPVQLLSIVWYITILTYIKMDIYCVSFPQPTHGIAKLLWSFLKKPRVILFIAEYQAL